ncbi:MFS transporter [Marinimicrobium sp. ABcell2]|uniref:MFS transporter n=1 Tax=Marinimicrobium sp. ABcell2 TaxID=3069751 RepID=UPI0027B05907|nr:glycoside-pentoside-hexuronide (GPH):cation symporter [Marinimicrobium sp. ABcell2]MDQ2076896.1 glycoside-pentoside-hexuronide (GPH):cation symporter [Marinimicrobium sp. ABcell2]
MATTQLEDRTARLRLREKLGYGFGDFGFNLYWVTMGSFLAAFYTDVFGLPAAAAGTMLFATKIIDAFTDPAMGAIADRTQTRLGKFRPYLLFAGIPMAGAAVLTFSTPDLGDTGKLVYAYITYTLMMLMYTVLSTPYAALSGVMTADSQDRTSLYSIRFIFAFTGGFFVNYFTLDLVSYFGQGDLEKGWQLTMTLYGFIAACIFSVTYFTTKERVKAPIKRINDPVQDIGDLLKNGPWLILFALAIIIMLVITMRGGSSYYYMTYFLERPDLLGLYLGLQMAAMAIGAASTPLMTRHVDKARLILILMVAVGILSIIFYFVPKPDANGVVTISGNDPVTVEADRMISAPPEDADYQWQVHQRSFWVFTKKVDIPDETYQEATFENFHGRTVSVLATYTDEEGNRVTVDSGTFPVELMIIFLLNVLISFCLGPKSPITWSMYADAADFNEWKTHRRATAMTFAAATFSKKLGSATGAAGILWILAAFGYVANEAQSGASQGGIVLLQTAAPGIAALIAAVFVLFYRLTREELAVIQSDLKKRDEEAHLMNTDEPPPVTP